MRSQRYNFDDLLMQLRRITSIESLTCHMPFWSLQANCRSSKRKTIRISRWKHRLSLTGSFRTSIWTESGKINTGSKKFSKRGYRDLSVISFCTFTDGAFLLILKMKRGAVNRFHRVTNLPMTGIRISSSLLISLNNRRSAIYKIAVIAIQPVRLTASDPEK